MLRSNKFSPPADLATAVRIEREFELNASHPAPEWQAGVPVVFCQDWRGQDPDPTRQTEVSLLWTPDTLYVRFECLFRELYVFENAGPNGRRDQLWDRDVAECFLQPDPTRESRYREFEVSPNGMWIDLDIFPGGSSDLKSGLRRSVGLDEARHAWVAEVAIPMRSLTTNFDPDAIWKANFYRVEGRREPRFYSAWRPTRTPYPNFHVPAAFGKLRFGARES
jgi:alpha-galactosidase